MRRGLGTSVETEADKMVSEMNELLGDPTWWNAAKRQEAELRFPKAVVDAFYDEIQAGRDDTNALRETCIHLPTREEGYSRVLFVGTTGAGKTSLLRHFIGSDPDDDRFPSTAPAKTTIADIEVVLAAGGFEGAVTFFTEFQIQANIEECITDACIALFEGAATDKVADRFLNHRDQKFRLSYVLGGWRRDEGSDDEELSFGDSDEEKVVDEDGTLTEAERARNRQNLEKYLARMTDLTKVVVKRLEADLEIDLNKINGPDREAAEQLVEENFDAQLSQLEEFHDLVQDVLDDVRSRFDLLEAGELRRRRSNWPELWLFNSDDRDDFIRHIRWFSSNYWPQFGRLLTPLVDGIRVKGPLYPEFLSENPKLALIDGQGLGHTPESSSSVTTHVTRRFSEVDVILLVDNAQQPMQAAPLSVLRSITSSGHQEKLAIAFTHFDQIKGQNLPTFADKRAHVMASVINALSSLRDVLGAPIVRAVEHGIDGRCFMLGGVDRSLAKLPNRAADYMREQLCELVEFFKKAILPPPPPEACPVYDPTGVSFAVQEAVSKFQGPWLARLGLGTYEGVRKEHWTRVKALDRRIAGELDVEYDSLRPVADLVARLTEAVSRFLDKPLTWKHDPADEQEAQAVISRVRRTVSLALHDVSMKRLVEAQLGEWRTAYDFRGTGSADRRARAMRQIYEAAAPLPDAVMTAPSAAFLGEIRRIVVAEIKTNGGEVRLEEAA